MNRLIEPLPILCNLAQPSPHFSYSEINALPLNGQQAVTAISALWLRRSTAFRWLQQPIGRHLMIDVVEQVIERHQEVKNEGISEYAYANWANYLERANNRQNNMTDQKRDDVL